MGAPRKVPSTSRLDEIVAEIVDLLVSEEGNPADPIHLSADIRRPDSQSEDYFISQSEPDEPAPPPPDTRKVSTEFVVRSTIQFLKEIAQKKTPLWGSKTSNADALSALLKKIGDLQETLSGIPSELLFLLAVKDLSEQVPSSLEQQNARERLEKIVATLNYLQARCDQLLNQQPGEHGSVDFSQRRAAEEAWRLMKYHNLKPASGVPGSAYGDIAILLFEAVTGKNKDTLQRACKDALSRAKDGPINEWKGRPLGKVQLPESLWNGKVEK